MTSSISSTAAGPVAIIAASAASASSTVAKPMIARPFAFGVGTSFTSAPTMVQSVPSDPHTRWARFTRSNVPGVDRSSWSRNRSRL